MNQDPYSILRKHYEAQDGSFLMEARIYHKWDWAAFDEMVCAMFRVAANAANPPTVERWIAHAFWFIYTWTLGATSHPAFPRPENNAYQQAMSLLEDLGTYFFSGMSPYSDNTLERLACGTTPVLKPGEAPWRH